MKFEIKHKLSNEVIFSAECASRKICVEAAVMAGADLAGADLSCANLSCANLSRANLADADLSRANLAGAKFCVFLGYPNGWPAFAWTNNNQIRVQVGCKNFTLAEGRAYWIGKDNRREVMAALDYAEKVADLRDWIKSKRETAA